MYLGVSAQIQRTFMGSSLGTSKFLVLQNFQKNGYTLEFDGRFYGKTKIVSFGGLTWSNISIGITSNTFAQFSIFTTDATQSQYQQVLEKINKKYSSYRVVNKPIPWYDDGKTIVYIAFVPSRKYLCLSYQDKKLLYKQISQDDSEL